MTYDPSKPVQVYWNLNKKTWSIRQGGKVVAYREALTLKDVTYHVQSAGKARVIREKQKNVHAYAKGMLFNDVVVLPSSIAKSITYNPYRDETFMQFERRIGHDDTPLEAVTKSNVATFTMLQGSGTNRPIVQAI